MSEIKAENIYLDYPVFGTGSRSIKKSLFKVTTGGILSTDSTTVVVEALKNVSFHLKHGDRLALVGHNGAGKSTLLQTLAGIYTPTKGQLSVKGRISSLLSLSLGMQKEATGYENIFIRGLIMGLTKKEIQKLIPKIEEFTEMGEFLNMPVKTYSSGMQVRLAFAMSTAIDAEILLIDEAIGAGDARFKEKARQRIKEFIGKAHILVLASHTNEMVKQFCNKALWLEHGEVKGFGEVNEILKAYQNAKSA